MLSIQVPKKDAQHVKTMLLSHKYFAHGYRIGKDTDYLYFPVLEKFETTYSFVEKDLEKLATMRPSTLGEALHGKIPTELIPTVKTTYDQVGDIAILEVDNELAAYEKIIGETLLAVNTKVSTVLAKDAGHEGTYRTQKMRLLAGEDKRVGIHKENGVFLEIDVEHVYYSARLSTERKRIMEQVTEGEEILVMFSGCGPYTCVLSKNTAAHLVTGVEINPVGHELAVKNIARNKLATASTHCGDVRDVVPKLLQERGGKGYDRILMPLPKLAETFLDLALEALTPGGTVHFYAFLHKDEFETARGWIQDACAQAGRTCHILGTTTCGQQAPYVFRICVDFTSS